MKSPISGAECSPLKVIDLGVVKQRWLDAMNVRWVPPPDVEAMEYWLDPLTGFAFYSPPQLAGDASLYEQLQHFDWYYMQEKWEFDQALRWIESLGLGQHLLEVGVGQGSFLQQARSKGLVPTGVELNPSGAAAARDLGFDVLMEPLSHIRQRLGDGSWDVICSFQVLEHLADPLSFLHDAAALLRPTGVLILSVPNAEVARQLDPERERDLLDQPPHHMGHWSPQVFRFLPSVLPLALESLAYEPLAPQHVEWFVASWSRQWRSALPAGWGRWLINRFSQAMLRTFLQLGFRRLIRGHTLMARFRRVEG